MLLAWMGCALGVARFSFVVDELRIADLETGWVPDSLGLSILVFLRKTSLLKEHL